MTQGGFGAWRGCFGAYYVLDMHWGLFLEDLAGKSWLEILRIVLGESSGPEMRPGDVLGDPGQKSRPIWTKFMYCFTY